MTKIPTIYLAGPIAGCTTAEATDWREYIKSKSGRWEGPNPPEWVDKFYYLDPMRRDYRDVDTYDIRIAKEIVEYDKMDICNSDAIIAHLDPTKASVGTHQEILFAWENRKLVVIHAYEHIKLSPWFVYHSHKIVWSLDDGIKFVLEHFE